MKNWIMALAAIIAFLGACKDPKTKKSEDGKTSVVGLKADDPTIQAFKDTAQNHMQTFIDSLNMHAQDTSYRFIVKSDFADGKEHEHMWSVVYKYADGKFDGIFADSAFYLKNIKPGQQVVIKQGDIEDWAIYDNKHNKEFGNFSDKYLRSKE